MVCNGLNQCQGKDSCDIMFCNVPLNYGVWSVVLYGFKTYRDDSTETMGMLRQVLIYIHLPGKRLICNPREVV